MAYGVLWLLAGFGFLTSMGNIRSSFQINVKGVFGSPLYFVLFFGLTSLCVWALFPRQIDVHYVLHIAPLIIVGMTTLVIMIQSIKTSYRTLANVSVFLLLICNLWAGLAPTNQVRIATTFGYPPLYRQDYGEITNFINYLRKIAGNSSKVYVVDSSRIMNSDIVHYAEVSQYGNDSVLQILNSHQVNSRDSYPLTSILLADYVIVTTPFQYHLTEYEQRVVKYTYDAFNEQWRISNDFKRLPLQFHLMDGAVLSIYERQSPTSFETILLTFDQMQRYIGRFPGGQPDWILITPLQEMSGIYAQDGPQSSVVMKDDISFLSLLYAGKENSVTKLAGKVVSSNVQCPSVEISANLFSASDTVSLLHSEQVVLNNEEFNLNVEKRENTVLVLDFQKETSSSKLPCDISIQWDVMK
ncbi:MAG: hypothetical protein QM730_23655 [Anaerolineales bacterium]